MEYNNELGKISISSNVIKSIVSVLKKVTEFVVLLIFQQKTEFMNFRLGKF